MALTGLFDPHVVDTWRRSAAGRTSTPAWTSIDGPCAWAAPNLCRFPTERPRPGVGAVAAAHETAEVAAMTIELAGAGPDQRRRANPQRARPPPGRGSGCAMGRPQSGCSSSLQRRPSPDLRHRLRRQKEATAMISRSASDTEDPASMHTTSIAPDKFDVAEYGQDHLDLRHLRSDVAQRRRPRRAHADQHDRPGHMHRAAETVNLNGDPSLDSWVISHRDGRGGLWCPEARKCRRQLVTRRLRWWR